MTELSWTRDWLDYCRRSRWDAQPLTVRHVNSCFFTMVAVDEERKPVSVPALRPFTPNERRRHAEALLRKEVRRETELRQAGVRAGVDPCLS